jgi:hypothetical protein
MEMVRNKRPAKVRPNRIYELTKARKWTYPDVAKRVRELAVSRGDAVRSKVHTVTINRLATGEANLTQEWMNILGEAFQVPPAEIISAPVAQNLRRVTVEYGLEAGKWRANSSLSAKDQFAIMIPNDAHLLDAALYGGEVTGQDNNQRYPPGSIAVISKLEYTPGEIVEGRRYHIRLSREDGLIEDSIKCLTLGPEGQHWFKQESNHPNHQEWIPAKGRPGYKIEIIGRVRGVFVRED